MGIKNFKLIIAYDGTQYQGWQRQGQGQTIQALIEQAIQTMTGESVTVIGSGRTDAGVHALGQVCHVLTRSRLDPMVIKRGLNSLLPEDIRVREAHDESLDFHARYSVKSKVYEYRVWNGEEMDLFLRHYVWHVPRPLDLEEMGWCMALLRGTHDFSAFRSSGSTNRDPVRTVFRAEIHGIRGGLLRFVLEADGFLRHMVRSIVGTVIDAGLGKIKEEDFRRILQSRDRREAGIKAPARGLFLVHVAY